MYGDWSRHIPPDACTENLLWVITPPAPQSPKVKTAIQHVRQFGDYLGLLHAIAQENRVGLHDP